MNTLATDQNAVPSLRALDPNLSFIASQAAIELDNLLLGKEAHLDAVSQLAARLRGSAVVPTGSSDVKNLMDPQTIDIFSRAITESQGEASKTIDDLAQHAWRIAGELGETSGDTTTQQVERLRAFCVALSRIASAHRQAIMGRQPSQPYRR